MNHAGNSAFYAQIAALRFDRLKADDLRAEGLGLESFTAPAFGSKQPGGVMTPGGHSKGVTFLNAVN